jgi:actin-like ATPase involved in cell morphogenesis
VLANGTNRLVSFGNPCVRPCRGRRHSVPCYVADDPLSCVAVGAGLALERMDILRDSLEEP